MSNSQTDAPAPQGADPWAQLHRVRFNHSDGSSYFMYGAEGVDQARQQMQQEIYRLRVERDEQAEIAKGIVRVVKTLRDDIARLTAYRAAQRAEMQAKHDRSVKFLEDNEPLPGFRLNDLQAYHQGVRDTLAALLATEPV